MARLAVTGANGYVGRNLTAAASALGWDVAGVVRSQPAGEVVARAGGQPVTLREWTAEALARAFAGAKAVVHLAGIGAPTEDASYEQVNVVGTRRAVEAARAAGVARVICLSGLGVARYGMVRRCTNPYFLSKLAAELELFRSGCEAIVFRPSWILGPRGALVPRLLRELEQGELERVGDGGYRLQPLDVRDAAAAILAAAERAGPHPAVYDFVGPEALSYQQLADRVARVARALGRPVADSYRVREIAVAEAERRAAAGGYRGLGPDELDCLLCDEVADARPLEALLGRPLTPLDQTLAAAVRAAAAPTP